MTYSKAERILGLSKIWRDIKYNFARFYEVTDDEKWDNLYQEYLPLVAEAEQPRRYYEFLLRFVATLNDGHTYILVPDEIRPLYSVDFATSYIGGKHILTVVPKKYSSLVGAEILRINGVPLKEYLEKNIYPLAWHANPTSRFLYGLLGYVIGALEQNGVIISTDKGDFIALVDDKGIDDTGISGDFSSLDIFPEHHDLAGRKAVLETNNLDIVITQDNIAVIRFKNCHDSVANDLYSNADSIKYCTGYIIDIRLNGGGGDYSCSALASLFIKNPGTGGEFYQRIYDPNRQSRNENHALSCEYIEVNGCRDYFDPPFLTDKPVAVLTSGYSASAAESFIIMIKTENRASLIGENSAGTNGQPIIFRNSLPGGGSYAICTMKCLTDDGFDYNNIGISPDVYCKSTVEDVLNGFDRVMDEGLKFIRSKI